MNTLLSNRLFVSQFILAITVFSLASCNQETKERPKPNIVWITSEDNSKHYLAMFDENGVPTPNIESLAEDGVTFTRAFSNAPVCSVARSAIISGCFGPRTFSQYHRRLQLVPLPDSLQMFPYYLRKAGYYTTNNSKQDYNFIKGDEVWDESSKKATWRDRQEGQPFFHIANFTVTHESSLHFTESEMNAYQPNTPFNSFTVQPNHPNSELFKYTNAYYRDKIQEMDQKVGEVIQALKDDGLYDNTFIFYYGDHGGVLPGSKGYIFETGLHVPMVVHIPENYKDLVAMEPGTVTNGFVNFIDLAPTVLNIAGLELPEALDGKPFLGKNITNNNLEKREVTYSYADRFDEKYDMVRGVRKGKFKYIRNYQPFNFNGLRNNYRYRMLAYQEWAELYQKKALDKVQTAFFDFKSPEALYDIESDPYETKNLAEDPAYLDKVKEMRKELNLWLMDMPDLSFYPEFYLVANAVENPVLFGQQHKGDIKAYIQIADLSLSPFESVKDELLSKLASGDPWERYWALTAVCSFQEEAISLVSNIRAVGNTDEELINRVMAAVALAVINQESPVSVMTAAFYACEDPVQGLLMLNSIVLMSSFNYNYMFDLDLDMIQQSVKDEPYIQRRLTFLGLM